MGEGRTSKYSNTEQTNLEKWPVPSRQLVSLLEERLQGSSWPPRLPGSQLLPPEESRSPTDTGQEPSLSVRSEDTRSLPSSLLAINMPYRNFVMTRTDLSVLICPVLKKVYETSAEDVNVLDEAFNILQILARDETFNMSIQSTKLGPVSWYKERSMNNSKLGGLVILVLLRAA